MTFWRQRLVLKLRALLQKAPQPKPEDFEQLNPIIFEEQRYHSWSDIMVESDQAYTELIALTDQVSEEDLTAFHCFDWMSVGGRFSDRHGMYGTLFLRLFLFVRVFCDFMRESIQKILIWCGF